MSSSAATLLKKVTARVFATPSGKGGNPVSIFLSKSPLSLATQTRLAQECDWESVMVVSSAATSRPKLSFYMPSGDEVNFCAHAAMGAVHSFVRADETRSASQHSVVFSTPTLEENDATVDEDDTVGLHLQSKFEQEPVHFSKIESLLHMIQLDTSVVSNKWPSLSNSSVMSRAKTMIGIKSMDALQSAQPPSDPEAFRMACDGINSTGIYLFSPIGVQDETTTYECRQFPSNSGYPEDPATGVAAAALAVGLHKECDTNTFFTFHQGTAMGRPSRIKIQDVEFIDRNDSVATYSCWGKVHVDDEEMITA